MGSETEPAKLLLPYLQRADELHKHEPIVAYYCRLYAMERGLKIPPKERTVTTNDLLVSLMGQLEKDKKSITLGPEDNLYVEGFASNVFAKADKQDRAGRADLNTAKTFYAASIFFEILNQFGELPPDIEQKQKYGVWKAAEIRKALKEGRRPEPGPPGGDTDLSVPSSSPASTNDLEPSLSFQASQPGGVTSPQQVGEGMRQHESFQAGYPGADESSQHEETVKVNPHVSSQSHSLSSSYSNHDYTSANFHQPPPVNRSEIPSYHDPYHHQSSSEQQPAPENYYSHENPTAFSSEQQPTPQIYYSHENPTASYSYPNFQSYPSFNDSTFPTTPTHQPSYYQGSNQLAPSVSNYQSTMQYDSSSQNGNNAAPVGPPAVSYNYDSNYQPPAEKIAEAHKAARFAVGALAFDEVSVGVDYLRRALELLTNPSAESH